MTNGVNQDLVTSLPKADDQQLAAHLSALNRLTKQSSNAVAPHDETLTMFIANLISQDSGQSIEVCKDGRYKIDIIKFCIVGRATGLDRRCR